MSNLYIGIDIGGTKTALILQSENGQTLNQHILPSNNEHAEVFYEKLVEAIHKLLENINPPFKIEGIGIGMPGIINYQEGYAELQNNLPLEKFPIVKRLQEQFQVEKVVIENDVKLAALMEFHGRQLSEETLLYITVSTGIAAAIIHAGRPIQGRGMAGEIGFSQWSAEPSLEADLSGPAMEIKLQHKLNTQANLANLLQMDNSIVQQEVEYFTDRFAYLLKEYILLFDPHVIVFGGGVVNNNEFLLQSIEHKLNTYLSHYYIYEKRWTKVESALYKGDSGVKGATLLLTT